VTPDDFEALLQFGRAWVFKPEKMIRLQGFIKPGSFDLCQAMVRVMQQVDVRAQFGTKLFEQARHEVQVFFGRPQAFGREAALGRFLRHSTLVDAIARSDARYSGLRERRGSPHPCAASPSPRFRGCRLRLRGCRQECPRGSCRRAGCIRVCSVPALDVPQCDVYGGNSGHSDRSAPPVCSAVKVLPDVLRLEGVTADEARENVLLEVGGNGKLTSVEGRIA